MSNLIKTLILGLLMAFVASGCGGEGDKGAEKTEKKNTAVKPDKKAEETGVAQQSEESLKKAEQVEAPGTKDCQAMLAKSWAKIKPALAKLKVPVDAAAEKAYGHNKNFVKICTELNDEQRACLGKAELPIIAMKACKAEKGKRYSLGPPSFRSKISIGKPKPLAADKAAAALAAVTGTWTNTFVGKTSTWNIAADGSVDATATRVDGKPIGKVSLPDSIKFELERRFEVHWKGSTSQQGFSYFQKDADTFLASTNLIYDAQPLADEKNFAIQLEHDYVVLADGKCEAIDNYGIGTEATCEFIQDASDRKLKISYTSPRTNRKFNKTLVLLKGHVLHPSLINSAYARKK